MRAKLITAAKLLASFPIAWFGGNIVFGILASGAWIVAALFAFLPDSVFTVLANIFLWLCRGGVFVALLIGWVFDVQISAQRRTAKSGS
jgi:hypothetical protein